MIKRAAASIAGVAAVILFAASLTQPVKAASSTEPAVVAIDVALEPDATMIGKAQALNARLRIADPSGYSLDATHAPHVTLLQRYVRGDAIQNVYTAVGAVLSHAKLASLRLQAFKITYEIWNGTAIAAILVHSTPELLDVQQQLIEAIAPFTAPAGSPAAFDTSGTDGSINSDTLAYTATFVPKSSGPNYRPHVTIGVAPKPFMDKLIAEPFESFSFSPIGVSIYQLGNYGTARKQLKTWPVRHESSL